MRRLALIFLLFLGLAVGWQIIGSRGYYSDIGANLVVVGDNGVAVVGVSKSEESLVWVDLPDRLKIDGYPAVSIWGLGEIDGNSEGLVLESFGEDLGLWFQVALKVNGETTVDNLLDRLLSLKRIKGLSWLDRYFLYKDISGLTSRGIVLETSLPGQVVDKIQDIDGYEWLELNEAIFVWSIDLWPNIEVVNLGTRVEVINVSETPGLARVRARQLESVGFRVVGVGVREGVKLRKSCLMRLSSEVVDKSGLLRKMGEKYLDCEVDIGGEASDFNGEVVIFVDQSS